MRKQNKPWHSEKGIPGLGIEITPVGYESLMASSKPDYSPKNLKALRRSLDMTQAELAKRAKVKQSTVSFFENGNEEKAGPGARARIAAVLLQAEFDRSIGKYGAPSADEKIRQLEDRNAVLERELKYAAVGAKARDAEIEEWKKRYDVALELLNAKQKNIVSQAEYSAKLEAAGLEELPPVEVQVLREEIEQRRGAKGSKGEK